MKNLLCHKKLCLVLDLDHTLLNFTLLIEMTSEEEYLKIQTDSLQDVSKGSLLMLDFMEMMTKLRPFVCTFLKEASEMFEMYIYTMGDRPYALEMAKLLDPQREYFSSRVISRDDSTHKHQKGLDVVLGQESVALILDDMENWVTTNLLKCCRALLQVWPKHKENLILMKIYHFFASSCHRYGFSCKSLFKLKTDELETDEALTTVLKVLKQVHKMFFYELEETLVDRDVRKVIIFSTTKTWPTFYSKR
ncbi:hypothetical protein F2P56_013598 [Juglans regia]|uniref:RNA polymerase II C-terminal domain phosphatase-like n=1 Tax=Juglans regia TaxID=51240 RepID=A0A834CZ90_JUGRE|nr:hypothetical protein F2P56_013598 [Juglans regia]